jgi:hypothetical protein
LDVKTSDVERLHAELERERTEKSIIETSTVKRLAALEEQLKLKESALANLSDEVTSLQESLHQRMEHV